MSIPIIGQSRVEQPAAERLPRVDIALGSPRDAPAASVVRDRAGWAELARHPVPMIRGLLLEHISRARDPAAWGDVLLTIATEGKGPVAERALQTLGEIAHAPAAELAEQTFKANEGDVAAAAAAALGRIEPARLLEAMRSRARLDDQAYVQTMSALARSEHAPALDWLGKSLNRAGALTPDRRAALYSAVLLSGRTELCARVIGVAISDSRAEPEPGQVPPARVALSSIAGLPPMLAAPDAAEGVLSGLLEAVQRADRAPYGVDAAALARAIEARDVYEALDALSPLLTAESAGDEGGDRASVLRRRRGLLAALLAQKTTIAQLPAESAAIFLAAAYAAGELIALSSRPVTASPALEPLSKILGTDAATLLAMDDAAVEARMRDEGERRMRQVAGALANEALWSHVHLDRWLGAIVRAGGGGVVFEAAATTKQEAFTGAALRALTVNVEAGEEAAVEALERRPLDPRATRLGLALAGRLGTERLVRAIARRYYDLRKEAQAPLADACVHTGDPRLAPLLESRAYADEAEELAWAMSALLGGAELTGALAAVVARYEARGGPLALGEGEDGIRLPLECKACGEVASYTMVRVYMDPKAKDAAGDPAFAGDVTCKACGTPDQLVPTQTAISLMMDSMMRLLSEQRAGLPPSSMPRVMPRSTKFMGREVGLAEALRLATKDAESSPGSIRAHLRRGRLRLALWRNGARADAEAALAIDGRSPEAMLLMGGTYAQVGDFAAALPHMIAALDRLRAEDEPRLYEADHDPLLEEVEDAILELEDMNVDIPATVDLEAARDRRDAAIAQLEQDAQARYGAPPAEEN